MSSLMRPWPSQASYEYIPRASSDSRSDAVETGASQLSAIEESLGLRNADEWQQLIDGTLIEMGRRPHFFADVDEEIAAPTLEAVAAAVKFACFARDRMLAAPGQALPDGDGGVVIQHALPDGATESFEADAEGRCSIWFYPRAPRAPIQEEIEFADDAF